MTESTALILDPSGLSLPGQQDLAPLIPNLLGCLAKQGWGIVRHVSDADPYDEIAKLLTTGTSKVLYLSADARQLSRAADAGPAVQPVGLLVDFVGSKMTRLRLLETCVRLRVPMKLSVLDLCGYIDEHYSHVMEAMGVEERPWRLADTAYLLPGVFGPFHGSSGWERSVNRVVKDVPISRPEDFERVCRAAAWLGCECCVWQVIGRAILKFSNEPAVSMKDELDDRVRVGMRAKPDRVPMNLMRALEYARDETSGLDQLVAATRYDHFALQPERIEKLAERVAAFRG